MWLPFQRIERGKYTWFVKYKDYLLINFVIHDILLFKLILIFLETNMEKMEEIRIFPVFPDSSKLKIFQKD